jgi:hypothetical protein
MRQRHILSHSFLNFTRSDKLIIKKPRLGGAYGFSLPGNF